jgi:glycosyltransferase involved in cell wall biosynthesis
MGLPRRLLSIGHSYVVGANRQLAHAIQRVAGARWQVEIVAPSYFHGGNDLRPVAFALSAAEPCPVTPVPAYLTRSVHLFFYNWWRLRGVLQRSWDVVHAWEEPYIVAGAEVAALAPRSSRFVFRTAQSLNKRYPPPFDFLERYVLGRAAGWICSGTLIPPVLQKRPGYARIPHRIIPLGVDTEAFQPDRGAGDRVRQSLGWADPGPPVVGYLGRFVPDKGLSLLTRALDAARTPWRALFVGAGPMEGELREWSRRHPDRVRICTSVTHDHVPPYLNAMDVLVAPSQTTPRWREQFGRMLIEAMACGVAVAGSDSGEIPHVIGDAGVVLPEADPAAWTDALSDLLESPARRDELGRAGLERARAAFAWPVVARKHIEFFDELLGGGGA